MKWLKRKLNRWLNEADLAVSHQNGMLHNDGISLFIYKADQGTIVETRIALKNHDHVHGLHIVLDGQDLGDNINKIITKEILRAK